MFALVRGRDQAFFRGDARIASPGGVHADLVDAIAPGIEGNEQRLVAAVRAGEIEQFAGRHLTHLLERRLDLAQHVGIDAAAQVAAQQRVRFVLVRELRGILDEVGGTHANTVARRANAPAPTTSRA